MPTINVQIEQLLLDQANPRFRQPTSSQKATISGLISDQGRKLVALARNMLQCGTSPIEPLLVMPEGDRFVVLEGNRRVLVAKLLRDPALAAGTSIARDFQDFAQSGNGPTTFDAVVFQTREAARPWIELRHTGELAGAGVVKWDAPQTARFRSGRLSQAGRAMAFMESVRAQYPDDHQLETDLNKIEKERLTTLGRLVTAKEFRERYGIQQQKDGTFAWSLPAATLRPFLDRILNDLATKLTVTDIKTKADRETYLEDVGSPGKPSGAQSGATRRRSSARRERLLSGFAPKHLGNKLASLVAEVQSINVDKFPNACALLIRTVLELSVDEVYEKKKWSPPKQDNLQHRAQRCLTEVDASGKDKAYQAVRVGLSRKDQILSVTTLHQFVHSPTYRATPTEIRTIATNYEPFLVALDGLAGKR